MNFLPVIGKNTDLLTPYSLGNTYDKYILITMVTDDDKILWC